MSQIIKPPSDASLELQFLAGLIHNGEDLWIEISSHINEKCFTKKDNLNLFRVCKGILDESMNLNPALIVSRFKSLGWTFTGGEVSAVIDNALIAPLNFEASISAAKELLMMKIKRDTLKGFREAAIKAIAFEGTNLSEYNSQIEEVFSDTVQINSENDELIDLGKFCYERVEETGSEGAEFHLKTPWETFNKAFEGFYPKESYGFAGRPSHGKSGMLLGLAEQIARMPENMIDGKPLSILYLDTEMEAKQQAYRLASCITDVNSYLLKSGKWRQNKEAYEKIRGVLKERSSINNFSFKYIPGMTSMQVRSIFRKWNRKVVKGGVGIVVFDYLKISGNDLLTTTNTSLTLAHKLDVLKDEIKENSNCILLFGCQRNRNGEDDDSSIAESDHIMRLASSLFLIKKKSTDEKIEEPIEHFGTHKLIPIKLRELGEHGANFEYPVKINKVWYPNWINLSFDNFNFRDKGDGRAVQDYLSLDIVKKNKVKKDPNIL